MRRVIRALAWAAVAATVLDAATTAQFLYTGTGREAVPYVAAFMSAIGIIPAILILSAVRVAAVSAVAWMGKVWPEASVAVLGWLCAIWWAVVAWNLSH